MTTAYAAHIVTADASDLGDPEIIVMTDSDENGEADPIASYPLVSDQDPIEVLTTNGWRMTGVPEPVQLGYSIVNVEASDVEMIVKHVTFARSQAEIEHARQDKAWRTVIRNAMNDGGSATRIAGPADISRERVYQIRDDRR